MRAIVILIVAAILGFFGYQYAANGKAPAEAFGSLTGAATEMAGDAVEGASDMAEGAVEGASDVAEGASTMVDDVVEAAADVVATPAPMLDIPTPQVQEKAMEADTMADASVEAETGGMAGLLSVDGFDADKVLAMIDGSELSGVQKTALSAAVNGVKDNPALLEVTLTRLKEALGL